VKTAAEPELPNLTAEETEFTANPLAPSLDAFRQHLGAPVPPMGTLAQSRCGTALLANSSRPLGEASSVE
jgi:hypothetical protein